MSRYWDWASWDLDWQTWGWIAWLAFFPVWETITGLNGPFEQLTHHLRPAILGIPPVWFVAFGLTVWIQIHFLLPSVEAWILKVAS